MDVAQKPNKSGQILDQHWKNIFCNFHKINSSQDILLYCKNSGVDGALMHTHLQRLDSHNQFLTDSVLTAYEANSKKIPSCPK